MKNMLLVIGCLTIFSTIVNAQQKSTLGGFNVTIPAEARKLSAADLTSHTANFSVRKNWEGIDNNRYMIGKMLLAYTLGKDQDHQKMSLENRNKMNIYMLGQHRKISELSSEIISINNRKFLITRYKQEGDYFITFTSEYDAKNQFMRGFLQYKLVDKSKAEKQLVKLLESVQLN